MVTGLPLDLRFRTKGRAYVLRVTSSFLLTVTAGTRMPCTAAARKLLKGRRDGRSATSSPQHWPSRTRPRDGQGPCRLSRTVQDGFWVLRQQGSGVFRTYGGLSGMHGCGAESRSCEHGHAT